MTTVLRDAFGLLVGKTWRGEFADSTPAKPVVDVARWEWILNGRAVRSLHSINDGEYGGETIIMEDPAAGGLVYFYFTTAGFFTRGKMTVEEGKLISHELVTGNQNGVTEVRAVSEILSDGRLQVVSQYLRNGAWVPGHSVTYARAPGAEVKFKPVA